MTTIVDVAKLAGVSISTVSRVLNNTGYPVRPQTRDRVLKAIEELHFRPNAMARGLLSKESRVIGLLVPDITNPYFPILSRGVEDVASEHGYEVILCNTDHVAAKTARYVEVLLQKQADGIVAAGSIGMPETYGLGQSTTHVVLAGRSEAGLPSVLVDNVEVAYTATKHLIALGHRHIGHISGASSRQTSIDRLMGYRRALEAHGIPFDQSLIFDGNFDEAGGYRAAQELLPASPTGVFAGNDRMALGVMAAAADAGLRVPADLSIVSCDDITMATYVRPALTSVRLPIYDLGAAAMRLMLSLLAGEEVPLITCLSTELMVRGSTGRART